MKIAIRTTAVALATILACTISPVFAQEKPEMSPEEQAMMAKWQAFMTPGVPHEKLAERAGEWSFTTRMWQQPGAEADESAGTSKCKMILGGRYMLEKTTGEAMGMPFEGIGITGYDNLKQEFVGVWVDSFGTGIMTSRGTCNEDYTVCTYEGTGSDPMSGTDKTYKMVDRKVDDDTFVFDMYDHTPDGKEWLSFQITYKRAE